MGRKSADRSAQAASIIDEVGDTNVNLPQLLAKVVSDEKSRSIRAVMLYLLALGDRCWDARDPQLPTQSLQARQLFCRRTSVDASDVGIRQSDHVKLPLLLVHLLVCFAKPAS